MKEPLIYKLAFKNNAKLLKICNDLKYIPEIYLEIQRIKDDALKQLDREIKKKCRSMHTKAIFEAYDEGLNYAEFKKKYKASIRWKIWTDYRKVYNQKKQLEKWLL